jgi:hypothetical protein
VGLIGKLAQGKKEKSYTHAQSLPDENEEDRRQRILRQKMRVLPGRPAAEKRASDKAGATDEHGSTHEAP